MKTICFPFSPTTISHQPRLKDAAKGSARNGKVNGCVNLNARWLAVYSVFPLVARQLRMLMSRNTCAPSVVPPISQLPLGGCPVVGRPVFWVAVLLSPAFPKRQLVPPVKLRMVFVLEIQSIFTAVFTVRLYL